MKKLILTISTVFLLGLSASGQPSGDKAAAADDKRAVLGVVQRLFDEMEAANAGGIVATGTAENQLVALQKTRDGKTRISVIGGEAFSKFFTKPGSAKEVMYAPNVEVSGDWAMVWGRYVFFAGGKLSHCGINQFNLVRTDGGWKIANGASTMDPGDCTEKERAMKPPTAAKQGQ